MAERSSTDLLRLENKCLIGKLQLHNQNIRKTLSKIIPFAEQRIKNRNIAGVLRSNITKEAQHATQQTSHADHITNYNTKNSRYRSISQCDSIKNEYLLKHKTQNVGKHKLFFSTPKVTFESDLISSEHNHCPSRLRRTCNTAATDDELVTAEKNTRQQNRSTKKRSKNNHVRFPTKKEKETKDAKIDKSMLGYDWIANILDNDTNVDGFSDEFFENIKSFREKNLYECHKTSGFDTISTNPLARRSPSTPKAVDVGRNVVLPLSCSGGGSYVLSDRYNIIPLHGPYSTCSTCTSNQPSNDQLSTNYPGNGQSSKKENKYIRVSIPRASFESPYKLRPLRRNSFDPSESVALSTHCLAGWKNSKPFNSNNNIKIDLNSHAKENPILRK